MWDANLQVYGVRNLWRQLTREGIRVARCSVARLMRDRGLQGAVRGQRFKTTIADDVTARPADLVNRTFTATRPNALWVAELTYVATWAGFVLLSSIGDVPPVEYEEQYYHAAVPSERFRRCQLQRLRVPVVPPLFRPRLPPLSQRQPSPRTGADPSSPLTLLVHPQHPAVRPRVSEIGSFHQMSGLYQRWQWWTRNERTRTLAAVPLQVPHRQSVSLPPGSDGSDARRARRARCATITPSAGRPWAFTNNAA